MSFLFGSKPDKTALAELIEDGRSLFDDEMKKIKYRQYEGAEPILHIAVRVLPPNEPPFEARMKVGISGSFLLKQGVRVQVKYDPKHKDTVILDDDDQAILGRNPQLIKK